MAVSWVVASCSLVEVQKVSEVVAASNTWANIALMMEEKRTFETLENYYQTTRRNNPEDSHLRITNLNVFIN
jgi:hypothetical protein